MLAPSLLPILLATSALAATLHSERNCHCPIPINTLDLPTPLSPLSSSSPPSYVTVGVGLQNYVCRSGNYSSVGADAVLLDISCIWRTSESGTIQDAAFEIWSKYPSSDPFEEGLSHDIHQELHIDVIGQHHFITENGALLPKFNLTKGNEDCFIVANKSAGAHAPVNSQENVDWLELKRANIPNPGQLANEVYRVFTKGGQPPRSCQSESSKLSVKYTAQYLFI